MTNLFAGLILNLWLAITPPVYQLTIPKINLEQTLISTGLNNNHLQEVPDSGIGIYKYGAKPGQPGHTILVGHTPGTFTNLTNLKDGDQIQINNYVYKIFKTTIYSLDQFPTEEIYGFDKTSELILITCHGEKERFVVYANLIRS